ncbi:MAG: transglutaminase family protein [Pseudomonadota bacterium]
MRLKIKHQTVYQFEKAANFGVQQIRLTPKSRPGHEVISWRTHVEGGAKELAFDDEHANRVEVISYGIDSEELTIVSEGEVETVDMDGVVGRHQGYVPLWCFQRTTDLTKAGPTIRAIAKEAQADEEIPRLHTLMNAVADHVTYDIGNTHAETTAEAAAAAGHGVCQDHAHIIISAARLLGYPARYVSGYLMMNDRIDQEASHAWAEVHVEGIGWIGFDVSNRQSPDARYVRVATGMDYRDAAPIRGVRFGSGEENLDVTIQVQQ